MRRMAGVFALVFFVALVVQASVWFRNPYVLDEGQWTGAINETAAHVFLTPHPGNFSYPYGYPGVPLIFLGAGLVDEGIAAETALRISLVVLIALGIALVAAITYRLRPESPWWIGAAALLALSDLYYGATPPSSTVLPLIVALVLLVLLAHDAPDAHKRRNILIVLGVVGGFALASRLDISIAVLGLAFVWLAYRYGREVWAFVVSGAAAAIAFNPYLWARPVEFVAATIARWLGSYEHFEAAAPAFSLIGNAPLAFVSFCALLAVLGFCRARLPVPRAFLVWFFGTTVIIFALLFSSPIFHPSWYFSPLLLAWEAFLPLFTLALVEALPLRDLRAVLPASSIALFVVLVIVATKALLFLTMLGRPF